MKNPGMAIVLGLVWTVSGIHLVESVNRNLEGAGCKRMSFMPGFVMGLSGPVLQLSDLVSPLFGYEMSASCETGWFGIDKISGSEEDRFVDEDEPVKSEEI